jgi:hypothetical protein
VVSSSADQTAAGAPGPAADFYNGLVFKSYEKAFVYEIPRPADEYAGLRNDLEDAVLNEVGLVL